MGAFDDFLSTDLAASRKLYRPDTIGTVIVQPATLPATVLLTERRPQEARQYQIPLPVEGQVTRRLPAGVYAITVTAEGQKPFRDTIEIAEDKITTIEPKLEPGKTRVPSFKQILAEHGIQGEQPPITLQPGERVVLDAKTERFRDNLHEVNLETLDDVKRILGHPDTLWPDKVSRFGAEIPEEPVQSPDLAASYAFRAAMREWVYGNSRSVEGWGEVLRSFYVSDKFILDIVASLIITVGPDAVLTIGTHGLLCGTLRVHITGAVKVVGSGPSVITMITYEQFS